MLIYKIAHIDFCHELERIGETTGSHVDVQDGFIHFSTAEQAPVTARKHFADQDELWLLAVDAAQLGDALRWEPSRGGDLFPHLYRPLRVGDVLWRRPLPLGAGGDHVFPPEMA